MQSRHLEASPIKLYDTNIEASNEETHLGINRRVDCTNLSTVKDRLKKTRRASYELLGAGFHQLTGVGPEVGRHMHNIYAIPRLVYGLEALILTQPNTNTLEASHKTSLRKIQHLPKSTATAAIYLLIGTPPLEATIHIKTICFFLTQLRRSDSIEYQLIERQLAMKKDSANSWTWYVNKLLKRYHLPSAFALLKKQPTKDV